MKGRETNNAFPPFQLPFGHRDQRHGLCAHIQVRSNAQLSNLQYLPPANFCLSESNCCKDAQAGELIPDRVRQCAQMLRKRHATMGKQASFHRPEHHVFLDFWAFPHSFSSEIQHFRVLSRALQTKGLSEGTQIPALPLRQIIEFARELRPYIMFE